MNVIIHYPTSAEGKQALAEKAAAIHAQTVVENLQIMPCPTEQKKALVDEIRRIYRNKSCKPL